MAAPNNESVQYNLLLNAQQALKELQAFNKAAISSAGAVDSLEARIRNFERVVAAEAKKAGVAFEQALASFEKLDAKMKSSKKGGIIGTAKGVDIFEETKILHSRNVAYEEQQRIAKAAFEQTNKQRNAEIDQLANATEAHKKVGGAAQEAGRKGEEGSKKATLATRVWSVAVGMLIHQGINLLINALQSMITIGLDGLKKLEVSVYNLSNAERSLSQAGIEVTFKGLEGVVDRLKVKFKGLFSKVDIQDMVADIAIATKELGLNAEQIEKIASSAATLQLRNPGKTVQEVNQQLLTAILSGQTKGIRSLGVAASEAAIEQEALALSLIKPGETANAQQKSLATLSLVYKATSKDADSLGRYLNSFAGKSQQLKSTWQDFLAEAAKAFGPGIKIVLDYFIGGLQDAMAWLEKNRDAVSLFGEVLGEATVIVFKLIGGILKFGTAIGLAFQKAVEGVQKLIDKYAILKKLFGVKDEDIGETPTGSGVSTSLYGAGYADAVAKTEEEVSEIMLDARRKREDMEREHQQKMADLARDHARKVADIARSLADKIQDAQRDYSDKVADINADTDKKIAETKQDTYKKSIEAEQKYQDELKNLREKYLMDLEDALRARDARQILRLMRQYALDKEKALENRNKEKEQAKSEAQQKLKDLEQERKEKLAQAAKDLADKIKQAQISAARERRDAAIAYSRQLQDARRAYQQQLAEQRLYLQRKLQDLAAAILKEYQLTAAGQAAINALIGSGGSPTSAANSAQYTSATPVVSSTWAQAGMYGTGGMAEGGTFLATRPATINVGENRPEIITATPLGKPGKDISKIFANGELGGGGGKIEIGMTLSPDLEARIISQTLSETANVVLKINRSK